MTRRCVLNVDGPRLCTAISATAPDWQTTAVIDLGGRNNGQIAAGNDNRRMRNPQVNKLEVRQLP